MKIIVASYLFYSLYLPKTCIENNLNQECLDSGC